MTAENWKDQLDMKGLDLSREYFLQLGKPAIESAFPMYVKEMAFGLVGEGSECYGFDDRISTDHDYGAGFCIWLPHKTYLMIGHRMNAVYDALPKNFEVESSTIQRAQNIERHGAASIDEFYGRFLGTPGCPKTPMEWLRIPQKYLAVATNGVVFEDNLGEFSRIREELLAYYPEDVRLKKMAANAITMAHYGQCNYGRMMKRGQVVAAYMALDKFIEATIHMVYLLNRKYAPYYKWMWRGMENFEILPQVAPMLKEIVEAGLDASVYENCEWKADQTNVNREDPVMVRIEEICALVVEELGRQGVSSFASDYLEGHAYTIQSKIRDERIRSLSIFMGTD